MKRGQGLPITTIIIAALGIIVLIILIVMVQQRATKFGTGVKEVSSGDCPGDKGTIGDDCDVIYGSFGNIKAGEICCKKGTNKAA